MTSTSSLLLSVPFVLPALILLLSLPLSIPAFIAFKRIGSPLSKPFIFMRNKTAAIGILVVCILVVIITFSFAFYNIGPCDGSFESRVMRNFFRSPCSMTYGISFVGYYYLKYIGLPVLVLYFIAEHFTRILMKRA